MAIRRAMPTARSNRVNRGEGRRERLHRKRQTVEQRTDHQSFEGECERVAGERFIPASDRSPRSERN